MNTDHNAIKELYKQIELLVNPVYEKYKDQFSPEDRKEYEEWFTQGEYELLMESLLGSLKKHSIKLDPTSEDALNQIYKLMEIERPVIE